MIRDAPCFANCEYCVTCIPLSETPIYAGLLLEHLNRTSYRFPPPSGYKPGGRITPILKNGRKPC